MFYLTVCVYVSVRSVGEVHVCSVLVCVCVLCAFVCVCVGVHVYMCIYVCMYMSVSLDRECFSLLPTLWAIHL